MTVKAIYVEPENYFPEEIRKKYKLGEYNADYDDDEDETEDEPRLTESTNP